MIRFIIHSYENPVSEENKPEVLGHSLIQETPMTAHRFIELAQSLIIN